MSLNSVLNQVKQEIRDIVPKDVEITQVEFEGPIVVIYTKSISQFTENNDIIRQLAKALRRRVAIRPDPSLLADVEEAEEQIKHIIPQEADIQDIYFDHDTGEVSIEAMSPGLAIGKHGNTLNNIKKAIGWAPKVVRAPPIPSKTVKEIRGYLRQVKDERSSFLKKVGRRIYREISDDENWIRITSLGGFREVGRSCALLMTRHSKVLIDVGVNVGSMENSSPYINAPEALPLEDLDALVITHAHLDHSGLAPLVYKYGYKGPVYCTLPTRDLMALLQIDYLKVMMSDAKKAPYDSSQVRDAITHCIPLGYQETTDIAPDIRLTFHNAGHILGSALAHFHVGDGLHNVVFSGDIKYEKTWLFNAAVNKFPRLESLIIESTYGGRKDFQPSRKEAAKAIKNIIRRTLKRRGHILIPVFAVGRSQEVMITLEQAMRQKELESIPIYLDGMIMEATAIHTAYPEFLNNKLRNRIFQRKDNPFLSDSFQRVDSREMREKLIDDPQPCIVLATSGMLNGGPVMEYLKGWGPDPNNSLVFVGYQADGTLGSRIQKGLKEINIMENGQYVTAVLNMNIETCDGFSGHSDRRQLVNYIANTDPRPERVIMNHGDESKCVEFASSIYKEVRNRDPGAL
jgi:KH/beta-lactamase-domain protein